jgi:hypothetical protein
MTWPADKAACYGIACDRHLTCQRYAAVEGNTNPQQSYIAMCGPTRPSFIPIEPVKEKTA